MFIFGTSDKNKNLRILIKTLINRDTSLNLAGFAGKVFLCQKRKKIKNRSITKIDTKLWHDFHQKRLFSKYPLLKR